MISCFSYYCFVMYHPKLWQKKNKHFLMLVDSRGRGIRGMAYFCPLMCGSQLGDSNGWGWGSHFQHSFFTHTFGTLVTAAKRLGFPWDHWLECLHMGSLIRGPKDRLFIRQCSVLRGSVLGGKVQEIIIPKIQVEVACLFCLFVLRGNHFI